MEKQDTITKLSFPTNIRTRPGMYIGNTEDASILLREIIDNSIDECYNSKVCNTIIIYVEKGRATIIDNGRGIPIKMMTDKMIDQTTGESTDVTMAYSSIFDLHSGSKFSKTNSLVGMNGVGSSVTNALSQTYELVVCIDSEKVKESTPKVIDLYSKIDKSEKLFYYIKSERGILAEEKIIKYSELLDIYPWLNKSELDKINIGTLVNFYPDDQIFDSVNMRIPSTLTYFKYIMNKIYNKSIRILINDEEYNDFYTPYKYEVVTRIQSTNPDSKNKNITFLYSFEFDEEFGNTSNYGSINGLIVNSGYHIELSTYAFKEAFNRLFPNNNFRNAQVKGLNFTTIVLCSEPVFNSQTKTHCSGIPGISRIDLEVFINDIKKVMNNDYDVFFNHKQRVLEYLSMTQNLSKIEYIKSRVVIAGEMDARQIAKMTPIKLRRCSTRNREDAELFICEGDSALGSLLKARNPATQAIMPLVGKPLNSAPLDVEEVLNNEEIKDIISAIGTGVDDHYNLDKIQYGKIIIAADSDADGGDICNLVLGLFYSHMSYLIEAGMVYKCITPRFIQGTKCIFDDNLDQLDKNKEFSRIKGLGELDTAEMKLSACNPETRRLIRITPDGMNESIRLITTTYARKQLMIRHNIISESKYLTSKELFG